MQLTEILELIQPIANHYRLTVADVLGENRKREIVECRHLCMMVVRDKNPGVPLKQIGAMFGGRDHSTVIHAIDSITNLMSQRGSEHLKALYAEALKRRIGIHLPDQMVYFSGVTMTYGQVIDNPLNQTIQ